MEGSDLLLPIPCALHHQHSLPCLNETRAYDMYVKEGQLICTLLHYIMLLQAARC